MSRHIVRLVATVGVLSWGSSAGAQEADFFKADHFEPLPAQSTELGHVSRSTTLHHLTPSAGVMMHLADDVLQATRDGDIEARLIDEQFVIEPSLAIGLFDRAQLGVILPAIVHQSGEAFGVVEQSIQPAALGDLRIVPKVRILDPDIAAGIGLAIAAPIALPTGDVQSFASDGSVRAEPRLIIDWEHASGFAAAANVGYLVRPRRVTGPFVSGDALKWGVGATMPVVDLIHLYGTAFGMATFEGGLDPDTLEEVAANPTAHPAEWHAGARFLLPAGLLAQLGGGTGITQGVGAPDFRVTLGLTWSPRAVDSDGDGLFDHEDDCPEEPGPVENGGCPWGDRDQDGVIDPDDACPDDPGPAENDGCPWGDRDADGVVDPDDECPDEPGPVENDGCPWGDRDGDGIIDPEDECPDQPEDVDGFQDEDGCPDPDNDRDGILDVDDKCPDEPEVINGVDDDDGCPDEGESKVRLTQTKIEILEKVYFDTDKATIKSESYNLLRQVGATIRANPQIKKIRIEGHTDSRASDDYNLTLSQNRAESVRDFLVEYGIASERLEPVGYGESRPVADNDSRSGRERNRRVEFNIIDQEGADVQEAP